MRDLPEAARQALEDEGVDVAAVICVDKQGKTHVMKNKNTNGRDTTFPIATTAIEDITAMSMVQHKGSNCITVIIDGVPVTICW